MAGRLARHERVAAVLAGPLPFSRLLEVERTTSTSDLALERVRAGDGPGLVVVADRQTAGRGRQGRRWLDGPGPQASLLLTAVAATPPVHPTLVPLAAGLASVDAVRSAGADPALKWPNDVLLGGRKAAGILVEQHRVEGRGMVLVGIGIDVDWRGVARDDERAGWTSVAEATGAPVDRGGVLADVLRGLAAWLHAVAADPLRLLVAYREVCATIGAEVTVDLPDGSRLSGRAVDLDPDGRLVVDTGARQLAVGAGDVHHVR